MIPAPPSNISHFSHNLVKFLKNNFLPFSLWYHSTYLQVEDSKLLTVIPSAKLRLYQVLSALADAKLIKSLKPSFLANPSWSNLPNSYSKYRRFIKKNTHWIATGVLPYSLGSSIHSKEKLFKCWIKGNFVKYPFIIINSIPQEIKKTTRGNRVALTHCTNILLSTLLEAAEPITRKNMGMRRPPECAGVFFYFRCAYLYRNRLGIGWSILVVYSRFSHDF